MSDDGMQATLACMGFFGTGSDPPSYGTPPPSHGLCDGSATHSTCSSLDESLGGAPGVRANRAVPWLGALAVGISLCAGILLGPSGPGPPLQDYVNRKGSIRFQLSQAILASSFHRDRVGILVIGGCVHSFLGELETLGGILGGLADNGTHTDIIFSGYTANRTGEGVGAAPGGPGPSTNASVWAAHSSICDQFLRAQSALGAVVGGALAPVSRRGLLTVAIRDPVLDDGLCSPPARYHLPSARSVVHSYLAPAQPFLQQDGVWDVIVVQQDITGMALVPLIRRVVDLLGVRGRACFMDASMRRDSRAHWKRAACSMGVLLHSVVPMGLRRDRLDQDWR